MKLVVFLFLAIAGSGPKAGAADTAGPTLVPQRSGLIANKTISFTEPSGLAYDATHKALWSVSDNARAAFFIPSGSAGPTSTLLVDHKELEGVSVGLDAQTLLFVRERGNLILRYDLARKTVTQTARLSDMAGFDRIRAKFDANEGNKGLEGITVDLEGRRVFVVKEAKPRLLIQISEDLQRVERFWTLSKEAGFRVQGVSDKKLDISGLAFDPSRNAIWMTSDQGGCVFLFDLMTVLGRKIAVVSEPGNAPPDLHGVEGIAIDEKQDAVFMVSDDGKTSTRFDFLLR